MKGSEYYTIYIRDIKSGKLVTEKIEETSGSIEFSLDDKFIFYSKLDEHHRPRTIYRHKIGTPVKEDKLIFEEKSEAFTVGIGLSSDEKYFMITSSDHNTSEQYYFKIDENNPRKKKLYKEYDDGKNVLRKAMLDFIPKSILERKKQGFSAPDENWYRLNNANYIRDIFKEVITIMSMIIKILPQKLPL